MIEWLLIFEAIEAIKNLSDTTETIKKTQFIDELGVQLNRINQALDEQILRDMRTGLQHLTDGLQSEIPQIRNDDFKEAHAKFNMLMSIDPDGITKGTSGEIPNSRLVMLGYWGNFYYFALRDDMRMALIRLYTCALRYPDSLQLFPSTYFNQDYRQRIETSLGTLKALEEQHQKFKAGNSAKRMGYYLKQGLRASLVGGVVSFSLPFIGLTGGWATSLVGALAGGIWHSIEVQVPKYEKLEDLEKAIAKTQKKLEKLLKELADECQMRLDALGTYSIDELCQLPAEAMTTKPKRSRKKTDG